MAVKRIAPEITVYHVNFRLLIYNINRLMIIIQNGIVE